MSTSTTQERIEQLAHNYRLFESPEVAVAVMSVHGRVPLDHRAGMEQLASRSPAELDRCLEALERQTAGGTKPFNYQDI